MQKHSAQRESSTLFYKMMRIMPVVFLMALGLPSTVFAQQTKRMKSGGTVQQTTYRKMPQRIKQEQIHVLAKGTSSSDARKAALSALPLDKLNRDQQKNVKAILANVGMFRKLPTLQFQIESDAYHFFAKHPDVACSIWRVMKISEIEMYQTGANKYEVDMKDGTVGKVTVLQQSKTSRLMICDGKFKSPFLTNLITATALVHMQTKEIKNQQGKSIIIHRASLFVSFPSQTVETAAKLISPISNMMIDRNFHEVSLFVQMMSLAMQRKPKWVEQTATKMDGVLKERKPELIQLTAKLHADYRKERLSQSGTAKVQLDSLSN